MPILKFLTAPFRWLLRYLFALVILFEEFGWGPLQRAMAWVARLPVLRQVEGALRRLPPYAALAALVLPSLAILPFKLLAVWLIAEGHALVGVAVILSAKLVGTALIAWLFGLIQPALMQLAWFAQLYGRWLAWKEELLTWVRSTAAWRVARVLKRWSRMLWRRIKSQFFSAFQD